MDRKDNVDNVSQSTSYSGFNNSKNLINEYILLIKYTLVDTGNVIYREICRDRIRIYPIIIDNNRL